MVDLSALAPYRQQIKDHILWSEQAAVSTLISESDISAFSRQNIAAEGAALVADVRQTTTPSLMEAFLAEYGLSTREGLALMCLAEALLRVPDSRTMDQLIEDKIMSGDWADHAGQSISALVNASTMGLQVTSSVLREGNKSVTTTLKAMVKRLGLPVIRKAVQQVMKELGRQFVLGQSIDHAIDEAKKQEKRGFTYSYDMLGEAAYTAADAEKYFQAYKVAIEKLTPICTGYRGDVRKNPGISVKLSALHPRYDYLNKKRVMAELVPKVIDLALLAKQADMGFNIDAEEADRLDLSLDVITATLSDDRLGGWDGFGIVVQAYGKRACFVIDYLYQLAMCLDRKIMVRLVKGAYWDAEIKRAQVMGLDGFPVYTCKEHTDISYMACAKKLLAMTERIYPQFATHNAHTIAAIMDFSKNIYKDRFEFQRLHGMGESVHDVLKRREKTRCRIYAPVGVHRDLLAYLVRRLLENGANSSFVNQIVDHSIDPTDVAKDPFEKATQSNARLIKPAQDLFAGRLNSAGYDETDGLVLADILSRRDAFKDKKWTAAPIVAGHECLYDQGQAIVNPAESDDLVGYGTHASSKDIELAFTAASAFQGDWTATSALDRAAILEKAAELYEDHTIEIFALLAREAGKTLGDAIAELREAVDFLRYYAQEMRLRADGRNFNRQARGIIACISPWNFPLAIFTGQIAAALVTGNCVIAKPAEQTPLIAALAISLLHRAGVPAAALQFLPGDGPTVGAVITSHRSTAGVCFTGSTDTAQLIHRAVANHCDPTAPLVAETGGLNAMIVDSTALPEQAVRDIIDSAFRSAGQRCSALRMLYIQDDVADRFLSMLCGAMDELVVADPWATDTDVGPVIDTDACDQINAYIEGHQADGSVLHQIPCPAEGLYVPPTVIKVAGIQALEREIFGPVLHVATYKADDFKQVLADINACGYGLTMGLHTRIDQRAAYVQKHAAVGNLYINRNQIGAIVGCQPFGGEGLSGTGPKAGGPDYLDVFMTYETAPLSATFQSATESCGMDKLQLAFNDLTMPEPETLAISRALLHQVLNKDLSPWHEVVSAALDRLDTQVIDQHTMPSPVGESNHLQRLGRGKILCLGQDTDVLIQQIITALYLGNAVVALHPDPTLVDKLTPLKQHFAFDILLGDLDCTVLSTLAQIDAVACRADQDTLRLIRKALAQRTGAITALISDWRAFYAFSRERHCCTDTTASGGDAALLAG